MNAVEAKNLRAALGNGEVVHVSFGVNNGQWTLGLWGQLGAR